MVGRDLEDLGGVREPVNLVEDDARSAVVSQEALGAFDPAPDSRELAVEVSDPVQ